MQAEICSGVRPCRPTQNRAIVDAGLKAVAFDSGPPIVCDEPAATYPSWRAAVSEAQQ
jgi:D-serine deaminase-like pyridoxal phosphate-dependent protein